MLRGIFYASAMLAAASFAAPAAAQTFEIEEPEAEAGEIEIEISSGFVIDDLNREDDEGAVQSAHEIGFGVGVTDYWRTGLSFGVENRVPEEDSDDRLFTSIEWENVFVLLGGGDDDDEGAGGDEDGLRLNGLGLFVAYEIPEEGGVNQSEIEVGPVIGVGLGPLELTSNVFVEFPIGDSTELDDDELEDRNPGLSYAVGAMLELREELSVGVELHGEIENVFESADEREDNFYVGPAAAAKLELFGDVSWTPHVALLFGQSEEEAETVFVFNNEFEF